MTIRQHEKKATLSTRSPDFIGPKMSRQFRKMLQNRRDRGLGVITEANTVGSPLFIGPILPPGYRKKLTNRNWTNENRAHISQIWKSYRQENKVKVKEWAKRNRANNKQRDNARQRERLRRIRSESPARRIRDAHSTRIRTVLKLRGTSKTRGTAELMGCSPEFAAMHIESQFKPGMTWDNMGLHGWHIDHIIPCAAFDLTDPDQQRMCFHYTNLRPMWAEDNIAKSDKITRDAIALIVSGQDDGDVDGTVPALSA